MSDPNLWTGVYREWVREPDGWQRYPIAPKRKWLWQEEWDVMIFGSRRAMIAAMRAAVREQQL